MSSILNTVKKMIGPGADYTVFDTEILILINSALQTLGQIGVISEDHYQITDASDEWEDIISDPALIDPATSYVYIKTRLVFDPPANSFVIEALKKEADELIWRMCHRAENLAEE